MFTRFLCCAEPLTSGNSLNPHAGPLGLGPPSPPRHRGEPHPVRLANLPDAGWAGRVCPGSVRLPPPSPGVSEYARKPSLTSGGRAGCMEIRVRRVSSHRVPALSVPHFYLFRSCSSPQFAKIWQPGGQTQQFQHVWPQQRWGLLARKLLTRRAARLTGTDGAKRAPEECHPPRRGPERPACTEAELRGPRRTPALGTGPRGPGRERPMPGAATSSWLPTCSERRPN